MVDRVAHRVHDRIEQILDNRLVQLGVLAFDDQVDLLVEALRKVAHETREAGEYLADGHHADTHDAFLELTGDASEVLGGGAELGDIALEGGLEGVEEREEIAVAFTDLLADFFDGAPPGGCSQGSRGGNRTGPSPFRGK